MNIFSKNPKKPKKSASDDDTGGLSPSPSPSPPKKTHFRTSKDRDENRRPGSGPSRNNSSSSRTQPFSAPILDPNLHPLNLPPDQLRRLSALSNMSGEPFQMEPMDIDREVHNGHSTPLHSPQSMNQVSSNTATPSSSKKVNGAPSNSTANSKAPTPPPHKSAPTSPITPQASISEEAEAFKTAGNKFYKAKEYKKAIEEYTKAVGAQPRSATYLNNRAAAYISAGQLNAALEDCVQANEFEPNNPKIQLRLARIYTSLGRPEEALSVYGSIQPAPSAKDVAPAKAMLQHIKGAEDTLKNGTSGSMALHALDQAEKLLGAGVSKPRKWLLMRGESFLKVGNVNALGEAQNIAMALLRNNSRDPEAMVLRGRALYAQGENEKAIQHFRQALNCDPDMRDAVKYLRIVQKLDRMKEEGNKEYKAGRWEDAVDKYTDALEVDPSNRGTNSKILQNRALCLIKLKDFDGAIRDCEHALHLEPSYTKARKTKASALGASGNWEDAVREWKSIQQAEPYDSSIAKEIRKAEMELKKSKRKDYYKILELEKDASESDIKKAYRRLAVKYHPDKAGPEDDGTRFKEIGEAYECLSDPKKKEAYDNGDDLLDPADMFSGGMHGGFGAHGIDREMLFHMMNSMGAGRAGGGFSFQ